MGWKNYPNNWNQLRVKVLDRDDYNCTKCGVDGKKRILHVHHKVPISDGGSHSLSNLTTLCRPCHEDVHGHPIPTPGEEGTQETNSPPCLSGDRSYICLRCERHVTANQQLRCVYCGHRVLRKYRAGGINEVEVR
jgi:DNA-directed RNA polymerase subunit RPC12/RpoP